MVIAVPLYLSGIINSNAPVLLVMVPTLWSFFSVTDAPGTVLELSSK